MKMENARTTIWVMAAVLAFVVTPALAEPTEGTFWLELYSSNWFNQGGGSGFDNDTGYEKTPWYYYENTDWYNQWFYDAPPDPTRWKEITWDILIQPVDTPAGIGVAAVLEPAWVTIALNWSTLAYPESGPTGSPPLPPLTLEEENAWIVREVIFNDLVSGLVNIDGTYIIPDYNPEWVSIDIHAEGGLVQVEGTITHE